MDNKNVELVLQKQLVLHFTSIMLPAFLALIFRRPEGIE